jgi:hypothetical protein
VRVRRHARGVAVVVTDAPVDADTDADATEGLSHDVLAAELALQPAPATQQRRLGVEVRCADLRISLIDSHDDEIARALCTDLHVRYAGSAATATPLGAAAVTVDHELDASLADFQLVNPLLGTRFPLACTFANPPDRLDAESSTTASTSSDGLPDRLACLHASMRWAAAVLDMPPPSPAAALPSPLVAAAGRVAAGRVAARRGARRAGAGELRRTPIIHHLILLAQPFELAIDEEQLVRVLEEVLRIRATARPAPASAAALLAPKVWLEMAHLSPLVFTFSSSRRAAPRSRAASR